MASISPDQAEKAIQAIDFLSSLPLASAASQPGPSRLNSPRLQLKEEDKSEGKGFYCI